MYNTSMCGKAAIHADECVHGFGCRSSVAQLSCIFSLSTQRKSYTIKLSLAGLMLQKRLRVLHFTRVPLNSAAGGGHLCCRNHVERESPR